MIGALDDCVLLKVYLLLNSQLPQMSGNKC